MLCTKTDHLDAEDAFRTVKSKAQRVQTRKAIPLVTQQVVGTLTKLSENLFRHNLPALEEL